MGCRWQVLKLSRQIAPLHFGKGEGERLGKRTAEKPSEGQGTTASFMVKVVGALINQKEVSIIWMVLPHVLLPFA